jgi:hypothetical protein
VLLIVNPMASEKRANYPQSEFTKFTGLLDKLLSVPHTKIKAELEAEKKRSRKPRDRAERRHAYRDVD